MLLYSQIPVCLLRINYGFILYRNARINISAVETTVSHDHTDPQSAGTIVEGPQAARGVVAGRPSPEGRAAGTSWKGAAGHPPPAVAPEGLWPEVFGARFLFEFRLKQVYSITLFCNYVLFLISAKA